MGKKLISVIATILLIVISIILFIAFYKIGCILYELIMNRLDIFLILSITVISGLIVLRM